MSDGVEWSIIRGAMLADLALLRLCARMWWWCLQRRETGTVCCSVPQRIFNMMPKSIPLAGWYNRKDCAWPTQGEDIPPIHTALCRRKERCAVEGESGRRGMCGHVRQGEISPIVGRDGISGGLGWRYSRKRGAGSWYTQKNGGSLGVERLDGTQLKE